MDPEVNHLLVLSAGYFVFSHMTLQLNIALHGKDNIADFLSRLPVENLQNASDDIDAYIKFVASAATPGALTTRAIEEASHEDPELQQIWTAIQKNRRADAPHPYQQIWDELTTVGRIVLRGCRIVVPTTLRRRILMLAHEGHQGIVKCKDRLRTTVLPRILLHAGICRDLPGCRYTSGFTGMQLNVRSNDCFFKFAWAFTVLHK